MKMKAKRADNVELFLFVAQANETFYSCNVHFRIEMTSTIENYHYEMMDTSWTTQLWQAALDQQLTDVEIFIGETKIEAHRVVLSARSPVLSVLLDNVSHVKPSVAIEENMDVDVVKHFLKFLYTGCLEMSATNKQLLELAELYQVKTLMKICQLANCISPDVTSKLDALPSKIDVSDKPSVTFEMDLEVVKHFLTFLSTGSLDSSVSIRQLTALAEMYEVETLKQICKLNSNASLDIDEVTTFLLTPF
jgi:ABC-type transporter Mla MlaB component